MDIRPGYGAPEIHLGQPADSLRSRFGDPSTTQSSGSFRTYWLYPQFHFECIVSERSGRILSIFFHMSKPEASTTNRYHSGDISLGSPQAKVLLRRPRPDKNIQAFTLSDGTFVGPSLSYEDGIGFHFDDKNLLQTISVFAPARKRQATPKQQVVEQSIELRRAS